MIDEQRHRQEARWRLPEGVTLLRKNWGDEYVVYNEASGQTHLIDAFSDWVLQELEKVPSTLDALVKRLVADSGADTAIAEARLAEALSGFDREGLAELQSG